MLRVVTLSFHWLLVIFTVVLIGVLIGRCDNFVFGFTTLNQKALCVEGSATPIVIDLSKNHLSV